MAASGRWRSQAKVARGGNKEGQPCLAPGLLRKWVYLTGVRRNLRRFSWSPLWSGLSDARALSMFPGGFAQGHCTNRKRAGFSVHASELLPLHSLALWLTSGLQRPLPLPGSLQGQRKPWPIPTGSTRSWGVQAASHSLSPQWWLLIPLVEGFGGDPRGARAAAPLDAKVVLPAVCSSLMALGHCADMPAVGTVTERCCFALTPLTRASPKLICKNQPSQSFLESRTRSLASEKCRSEESPRSVGSEQSRWELG